MIRLDNITWRAPQFALSEVSFAVPTGKYAVLMGRTGTGKTSLLEIICGLRSPAGGSVWLELSVGNLEAAIAVSLLMVGLATVVLASVRLMGERL